MPKYFDIGFQEFVEENVKELTATKAWMKNKNFMLCKSNNDLRLFIDKAIKYERCVLDVETTGLNTRMYKGNPTDKLVGIGLAYDNIDGLYVPVGHKEGAHLNLFIMDVLDEIKRLCSNCKIIVHNAKFDLAILRNYGIIVDQYERFDDTLILARLYDAGQKEIGLKHLSETLLNQPMIELKEIAGKENRLDFISPEIAYTYVSSDAVCTMDLYNFFMQQETVKSQKAIYNLEKRVVPVVLSMESNLIYIDKPYLEAEKIRISGRIEELKQEIYRIAGKQFNVGSTQQLGKVLFDELKYKYPENTKTESGQYKTDTAVLEKISVQYPMVKLIVEFRNLEKSLGTYIENLLNNCDEDSCIKLSFNQNGTDTGRFSSPGGKGINQDGYSAVNVQSIPANYDEGVPDIRKAFKARLGKKIVAIDFSGEELRIAANLSGEPKWINEFLYGEADLHTATGKSIYKKDKISPAERSISKTCNFQILYGAGPRGISEQAHISETEARRAVAGFFEGLPQLAKWIEGERRCARKLKYVKTPFGRIRPLQKFYDSGDKASEAHADRCAVNFRIQGSGADIMKTVMVRVYNWIHANNLQDEIKILITMHDELVFEMPEDKLATYIPPIYDIMCLKDILQGILGWPVPLTVDAEYGDTWHVDHNFFEEHPELKVVSSPIEFSTPTQITETPTQITETPTQITETPTITGTSPEQPPVTSEVQIESVAVESTPTVSEGSQAISEGSQIIPETSQIVPEGSQNVLPEVPSEEAAKVVESANDPQGGDYFIYTVKSTTTATLRLLNSIIPFVTEESKKGVYRGSGKILRLVDREGNMFLVSEFTVNTDAFIALARFFNI